MIITSLNRKTMNISQLKDSISVADYLNSIGLKPARKYSGHYWYHSPFHQDKNPSFVVNLKKDLWFDLSSGKGGDLIEMVKMLHQTDVAGAIVALSGNEPVKPVYSLCLQNSTSVQGGKIEISQMRPINSPALIQYLLDRMILLSIARKYLKEAHYTTGQAKRYFALAFQNDQGGFALRNKFWKGSNSPAYFTTIPGKSTNQINIFEGVFDFLSALVFFNTDTPKFDCLVLNSTSHLNNALSLLPTYQRVNLFLDNDKTGFQCAAKIREAHQNVIDYAPKIYLEFNDFNDFLKSAKAY
jgi:hypothetical protein